MQVFLYILIKKKGACRVNIIDFLNNKILNNDEGFRYLKWCKDKFLLNLKDIDAENLKQNRIYWVNMGVNIGSELRKLRPVILWRATADKKYGL